MSTRSASHQGPDALDCLQARQAGRDLLALALMDARNHLLQRLGVIVQTLEERSVTMPRVPELQPPWWLAGHVAWFAEYWIGRNPQRGLGPACPEQAVRLGSIDRRVDAWFNPEGVPQAQRWTLQLPDGEALRAYLLDTLESTLELLDKTPEGDAELYFFRAALFHEDLRTEQLVTMAQTLGLPLALGLPTGHPQREPLCVPAGRWELGWPAQGFARDIEQPAHEVAVPEFEIDAQPVSWAQFVEFVDDGGYDRVELWHADGWRWLQALEQGEGRRGPRHVEQIGVASGAVMQTLFGRAARMAGSQSAMHVSWWEADAWARWAGRRLPTEMEWEMAAHAGARRGWRWGDVLEWTAGTLRPWQGFRPAPWSRSAELDGQAVFGLARVIRGASFATPPRLRHTRLRRYSLPGRDDGFVGFRTCAT